MFQNNKPSIYNVKEKWGLDKKELKRKMNGIELKIMTIFSRYYVKSIILKVNEMLIFLIEVIRKDQNVAFWKLKKD